MQEIVFSEHSDVIKKETCKNRIVVNEKCNDFKNNTEKVAKKIRIRYNKLCRTKWGVSGALYSQSATARVMPSRGRIAVKQPLISDVDTWVLRNRNP